MRDLTKMTIDEAAIIIGNLPIYPDDCYTVAEYQWAKGLAIKALHYQRDHDISESTVDKS